MEREIKIKLADVKAMRVKLKSIGAQPLGSSQLSNEYFDLPDRRLTEGHELLRLRNNELLTYKRRIPDDDAQLCEELEAQVKGDIKGILIKLGFEMFHTTKRNRESYLLDDVKIELDRTNVGDFLEIEGRQEKIDETASKLGFSKADHIKKTYTQMGE